MREQTDEKPLRLVLLDDHGLLRASLARLLVSEGGFDVAGEYGTSREALEILNSSAVDVVLLGLYFGQEHANDFIPAARKAGYQGRFLVVADAVDAECSAMALKLGASGIFLKTEAPQQLVQAIRLIATGAVWVDQKIIQLLADHCLSPSRVADRKPGGGLVDREQRVLVGILGGLTNRKIADGMGLSESSVKNILQALFSRAGVRTRSQLVRLALEGSLGNVRQLVNAQGRSSANETPATDPAVSIDAIQLSGRKESLG